MLVVTGLGVAGLGVTGLVGMPRILLARRPRPRPIAAKTAEMTAE